MLAMGVLLAFALSLMAGKVWVGPSLWFSGDPRAFIIFDLRLPRALLGAGIGAASGLAGAVLQSYLRNPLADPGLLGVSTSAALGAVLAIFLGFSGTVWVVPLAGVAGGLLGMLILMLLVGRSTSVIVFILAGIILANISGALTALLISLAPTPFATSEIVNWLMGALTDRSLRDALIVLPMLAVGSALLFATARMLDALVLGEAVARTLGVNVARLQWLVVIGIGLAIGGSTAVTGVIGFVGLVVPHLVRPLVGQQPSLGLLPSALAGAILLLTADALVRLVPGASELRLGVAMALVGGPFFLLLINRMRDTAV
ncbi:MAG: iron ABC transporter permease [Gammaproteobacteria bacterium]|nr:iron ABC transporter permease [Gammaproteobacteria bacterium]